MTRNSNQINLRILCRQARGKTFVTKVCHVKVIGEEQCPYVAFTAD